MSILLQVLVYNSNWYEYKYLRGLGERCGTQQRARQALNAHVRGGEAELEGALVVHCGLLQRQRAVVVAVAVDAK